jgi:uncharacterized protein (UPF0335 family)
MAQEAPEGSERRAEGRFRRGAAEALNGAALKAWRRYDFSFFQRGDWMPDIGGIAGERLRSFIERIERLEEEKRALSGDIKEVFAEAKGNGFDTKIMRQLIRIRRMDKDDLDEQETLLDVYKRALGMLPEQPASAAAD